MCHGKKVTNSTCCLFVTERGRSAHLHENKPGSDGCDGLVCMVLNRNLSSSRPQKRSPKSKDFLSVWERPVLPLLQDQPVLWLKKQMEKEERKVSKTRETTGAEATTAEGLLCSCPASRPSPGCPPPVLTVL